MNKRHMTIYQFFKEVFKRYPFEILLITALLIVTAFFEAVSVASIFPILSSVFNGTEITQGIVAKIIGMLGISTLDVSTILFLIIGLSLFSSFALFCKDILIARIRFSIQRRLRNELMQKIFAAQWRFHLDQNMGTNLNIIFSETQRISSGINELGIYYSNLILTVMFFVFSLFVMWKAVLFICIGILILTPFFKKIYSLSRKVGQQRVTEGNHCNSVIIENLSSIKYFKAGNLEEKRLYSFTESIKRLFSLEVKEALYKALVQHFLKFFSVLLVCGVFYFCIRVSAGASIDLMFLLILIQRAFSRFMLVQVGKRTLVSAIPGFEFTLSLIDEAEKHYEEYEGDVFEGFKKQIEFRNVHFSYLKDEIVLRDFSFIIPKNQVVALVGPSGAGKTTAIDMILGLIDPDQGTLMIDDKDLRDIDKSSFRQRVGYVPQETILLNSSIRDNIAILKPDSIEEEIVRVAKIANAHEFIMEQERGYDTLAGESGVKLSGGQKQRIALARALINDPEILLLDEATSALDNESEKKIQQAIESLKGKMTLFIIAHRLTTVQNADVIHYLKGGQILESGSFEDLKALRGEFLKMYNLSG